MLVDSERVLLEVKRRIGSKTHWGQRELALMITELEAKFQIEEGLPERALRLYGMEFFREAVRAQPISQDGRVRSAEGNQVRASRGGSYNESEEDTHVASRSGNGRAGRHAASGGGKPRAGKTAAAAR